MPAKIVYCRHPGCSYSTEVLYSSYPAYCQSCGRSARWSVLPMNATAVQHASAYELNYMDKRMLRAAGIARD